MSNIRRNCVVYPNTVSIHGNRIHYLNFFGGKSLDSCRMFKLFAFVAFTVASISATVTDCGAGKSIFTIQDQSFSPSPPVSNQPYDYWFTYTVPDGITIDAGTAKYSLSLNGIPLTPTVEDLCTQTTCPKTSGLHNESSTDTWPSGISGKVVTKLEWYDANSNLLLCSQVTEKV